MNVFNFIKNRSIIAIVSSVIISFGFVAFAVNGATTISTNISTGGTLSVTGLSTLLGGATTTTLTLLNGEVISNATDGVIQLGGIASTTSITLLNGETITNATDGTIALTGAMTVSGASTLTGLTTHGGNIVSDTDSTDSLGITGTRWASIFSDNFTGNTITLDGATGINILTITNDVADALSIIDVSGDLIAFDTRAGVEKITITPELTTVNGYVSQASSTVVGNLTVTGTFSPTQTAATTFAVGGGYGATGSTLSADGNIQANGALTIDGASTLTGLTSMIQASSTRLSVFDTAYFGGSATSTFDSNGNLSVIGTLSVTGASTLTGLTSMIQASSTRLSVFDTAYFGGSATSTFDSNGNLSVIGTLSVTGASTLTGLTSMIQASSTRLSVFDTAYFGGTATSSFTSAGVLTLTNGETIANATDGTITLGADVMKLVGTASTSAIRVGDEANASTINGLVFGYCTVADIAITASTSAYKDCTGATGVISGDRVFIQATSSLPARVYVQSASSTATAGTIQIQLFNTGIDAGDVGASVNSFNFWAVRD